MTLIRLQDICKSYVLGEMTVEALRGVSLEIDEGEYVALMGPSGSGKSTLMNTLGCLDRPTSGSYLLDGEEVVEHVARRAGPTAQPQDRLRLPELQSAGPHQRPGERRTAAALLRGMSGRERRRRAKEVLERVGLADRMDHHPGQLSGGQQQRVAIARALVNRPAILMADEPTGNLDSRTSREVMEIFGELNREEGITIILVTHDQDVARHARRCIVLRDGLVVEDTADFTRAAAALHVRDDEPLPAKLVEPT